MIDHYLLAIRDTKEIYKFQTKEDMMEFIGDLIALAGEFDYAYTEVKK